MKGLQKVAEIDEPEEEEFVDYMVKTMGDDDETQSDGAAASEISGDLPKL